MKFYARRLTFYIVTLWAAISFNFFIPRLLPGNPADILLAKMARNGEVPPAVERNVRLLLGGNPDESMWTQYVQYWQSLFQGNLGVSITKYPTPVTSLIGAALPWTIGLVGTATVIAVLLGVGLGAIAGWKRGTWVDNLVPASTLMQSLPYFWVAILLSYIFSVQFKVFPRIGGYDVFNYDGPEWSWGFAASVVKHAFLPALTIVLSAFGGWMLGMRNMMVSTLSEDYITTAEAKGLRPRRIFMTYATRNAALPSIAGFAVSLGFVVAGSIVMEQVFTYPGIGKLMITAVQGNDYALMQGVFLVITLAVLSANLLMDLFYGFVDPRVRARG